MIHNEALSDHFQPRQENLKSIETRPLLTEQQIFELEPRFDQAVKKFQDLLNAQDLHKSLTPLLAEVLYLAQQPFQEAAAATEFFALVSAIEEARTGHHHPAWEQAAAALYVCYCHQEPEIQSILMAPGEGKTFMICLANVWRVLSGVPVDVYTDKQANVEQSFSETQALYKLLGIESEKIMTRVQLTEKDYLHYLMQMDDYQKFKTDRAHLPWPKVRYGVWSNFIHEYLARQDKIAVLEAVLAKDTDFQRSQPEEAARHYSAETLTSFQAELDWLNQIVFPGAVIVDEGDAITHFETSPVIETEMLTQPYDEQQTAELELMWRLLGEKQNPQTLHKISSATGFSAADVERNFQLEEQDVPQGFADPAVAISHTPVSTDVALEKVYVAKLLEIVVEPSRLKELAALVGVDQDLLVIAQAAATAEMTSTREVDWTALTQALSPAERQDLRVLMDANNPIFNFSPLLRTSPKVNAMLALPNPVVTPQEWQALESYVPNIRQLVTVARVVEIADELYQQLFSQYSAAIFQIRSGYVLGDNYRIVSGDDGQQTIEVIGDDRQPQPGKQFHELRNVFLHLKHGLPLPRGQKVHSRILPITWFTQLVHQQIAVTSVSGSQDHPDYVVNQTGAAEAVTHRMRVFPDQDQKKAAIVELALRSKNRPVLICAQDKAELDFYKEQLRERRGQEIIEVTANEATQSGNLVPQLEKGKVLLLQITARGLNIGRLIHDEMTGKMTHSFEDGVLIIANAPPEAHARTQLRGRLGNRRANGEIFEFDALDGETGQERYAVRKDLSVERHQKFAQLEQIFQSIVQQTEKFPSIETGTRPVWNWPPHFAAAMELVDVWEESDQAVSVQASLWMALFSRDVQIPQLFKPWVKELRPTAQQLRQEYEKIRNGHVRSVEYQQQLNIEEMFQTQREQLTIDQAIQTVRNVLLHPTADTPLGQEAKLLAYEERLSIMEIVFDQADLLYPISTRDIQNQGGGKRTQAAIQERKLAKFLKDLSEWTRDWLTEKRLNKEYSAVRTEILADKNLPQEMFAGLPEQVADLGKWLENLELENEKVLDVVESALVRLNILAQHVYVLESKYTAQV